MAKRVLVVDDEAGVREAMRQLLEYEQIEVRTVGSGDEALAASPEFAPHLVFLDVKMAGMDQTHLPLRFLTRYYYHLSHNLAREKSYALAILYLKVSEYSHPHKCPFQNIFRAASRAVLHDLPPLRRSPPSIWLNWPTSLMPGVVAVCRS